MFYQVFYIQSVKMNREEREREREREREARQCLCAGMTWQVLTVRYEHLTMITLSYHNAITTI